MSHIKYLTGSSRFKTKSKPLTVGVACCTSLSHVLMAAKISHPQGPVGDDRVKGLGV